MKGGEIVRRTSNTDCYSTPAWATEALLKREHFPGTIYEPAAGEGAIVDVLVKHRLHVFATDILGTPPEQLERNYASWGSFPRDFLGSYLSKDCDHIITNPPFSQALPFAIRALEVARCKVAFFLRVQFLESKRRYEFLMNSPLKAVYMFSLRCSLVPFGSERKGAGGTALHAWFVWDHDWTGEPVIRWIPPREE